MMYTKIREAIISQYEHYKESHAQYINDSDSTLRSDSTATRWAQYNAGEISREKCVEYAVIRNNKRLEKEKINKLNHVDRIENAGDITEITISINWTRSATWGYNPHATVTVYTNKGYSEAYGSASGCGYDKRSAAVAEAMNKIDSCLKLIYNLRENDIKPYGSGTHSAYPYFEGGVGIDCYHEIMRLAGFEKVSDHGTRTTDFYHYKLTK